jgi:hypothetical protein
VGCPVHRCVEHVGDLATVPVGYVVVCHHCGALLVKGRRAVLHPLPAGAVFLLFLDAARLFADLDAARRTFRAAASAKVRPGVILGAMGRDPDECGQGGGRAEEWEC